MTNPETTRDRIAEALIAWTYRGKDPEHGGILETVRANAYGRADAVLAVLPEPADRAAFVAEAEAKLTAGCPDHGPNGGWLMTCQCEAIGVLQDLAAEAAVSGPCVAGEQQNETPEAVVARVLYVAEVIEANGIGWAADSIRRACRGDAEQPRTCAHCGQVHAASSLTHFGAPGGPWYCVDRDDCRGAGGLPPRKRTGAPAVVAQPGKEA